MRRNLALLFATAALVAACGGDDDPVATAPPPVNPPSTPVGTVPDAVNLSVANFIGYIQVLLGQSTENTEALDVANVVPPLSDTTEPMALP